MTEAAARALSGTDISAVDLLLAVARHKKSVLFSGLALGAAVGLITLCLPNLYTATTRILPPQQTPSAATAMLGQMGVLGNLAGRELGLKNPNDVYLAMLSSRTVADALIERFGLDRRYRLRSREMTRQKLEERTTILNGKDGMISVVVEDEDPAVAAQLSNAYVEELAAISQRLAVSEAARRRMFYEGQLRLAKDQLDRADAALRDTQTSTGLLKMGVQSRSILGAAATLRSRLMEKQVQLAGLRSIAGDENPDYVRAQREIAGLKSQLAQLERGGKAEAPGDVPLTTGQVPQVSMEYGDRFRQSKYYQAIFELIAKQYELAKIDEGKEAAVIQVLDRALAPEKKSGPARLGWSLLGFFTGAGFAMLAAMVRELPLFSEEQLEKLRLARACLVRRPASPPGA